MKRLLLAALPALLATPVLGLDQADLDRLVATNECQGCDLDGALLGGRNMSEARLAGANISNTFIRFQTLDRADLTGALAVDAYFQESSAIEAVFAGANMAEVGMVNSTMRGADFQRRFAHRWEHQQQQSPARRLHRRRPHRGGVLGRNAERGQHDRRETDRGAFRSDRPDGRRFHRCRSHRCRVQRHRPVVRSVLPDANARRRDQQRSLLKPRRRRARLLNGGKQGEGIAAAPMRGYNGEWRLIESAWMRQPFAILATALLCAAGAACATEDDDVARGLAFVTENCSRCHAVGPEGRSPIADAPPFRAIHELYPVEFLEEALAEGIVTGHPDMPQFALDADRIADVIAYLRSLDPAD
jgi:cytochrome c